MAQKKVPKGVPDIGGAKQKHLRDLFNHGENITISVYSEGEMHEIELFMARPNPMQQGEAARAGRTARARARARYVDGDEALALRQEIDLMTKEELVTQIMGYQAREYADIARNDVMFNDDVGSDWGETDGRDILGITAAYTDRYNELSIINEEREEEEQELINIEADGELLQLRAIVNEFETEVDARAAELQDEDRAAHMRKKRSVLIEYLYKKSIEVEGDLEFYQFYQTYLIWAICRDPQDHGKHYFQSTEEYMSFPLTVRSQIQAAYEAMEMGVSDVKNWLSLLPSSDSSE